LQLRDVDHLSTDEAAQRLGISTGAMKVRLHRARARLRAILQEIGFER
jgi:RNA polymerase sigma-70 factor (ECF subfamily)